MLNALVLGAGTLINVSDVQFTDVFNEVLALVPAMLGVMISFIAVRKGLAFIKSTLRGA